MQTIKTLRKQKKLTMKQLGSMIGVSDSTVSLYENDKRQPDNDTLCKLADALECTTDYLLGREIKKEIFASDNQHLIILSFDEIELVSAYREKPDMQEVVKRVLDIKTNTENIGYRLVAFGGDNVDDDTPIEPHIT